MICRARRPLVYFGRKHVGGPVKIGCTTRLEGRAASLGIDVLAFVCGFRVREAFLHCAMEPWKREGEWFEPASPVQQLVAAIRQAGDVHWLPAEPRRCTEYFQRDTHEHQIEALADEARRPGRIASARAYGRLMFLAALNRGDIPSWISAGHAKDNLSRGE